MLSPVISYTWGANVLSGTGLRRRLISGRPLWSLMTLLGYREMVRELTGGDSLALSYYIVQKVAPPFQF